MSDTNAEDVKKQEIADDTDTPKNQVDCDSPVEDLKNSDKNDENSMPSPQQEEEIIKKKYGGLLPKKSPLISRDHERALFYSADWALGKQGAQKPKGPLEGLCPKLQPTPHQQVRSRRSAYAPADDEVDGGNNDDLEDQTATEDIGNDNKDAAQAIINKFHPPRADWYKQLYAWLLNSTTKSYEAKVARYKSQIFSNLRGKAQKILEIGIGAGPNLSYYASNSGIQVVGIDPNEKMEKYARSSAELAGLPPSNFEFIHAVGEVIPIGDASVDAVIGTLVLCSVKDVDLTLKEVKRVLRPGGLYLFVEHVAARDRTLLRLLQRVLDPLQQALADGCHLSRETGNIISKSGFSSVDLNMAFVSNAALINPHIYGVAYK